MIKAFFLAAAICFMGCSSASSNDLHALSYEEAPRWSMVSLRGLDEVLKISYETKLMPVELGSPPIALEFEGVDFETFKKVDTSLKITTSKNGDRVWLSWNKKCAALGASYELLQEKLQFKAFHMPGPYCSRMVPGKSGKLYRIPTQYLIQMKFMELAPHVEWYNVSTDGKTLKLLDSEKQELGVFELMEAAE